MRAVYGSLLGLVISGTSGCLLFTDTINVPPTVSIAGPAQVRRGRDHMFTARVENEAQARTTFSWGHGPTCPTSAHDAQGAGLAGAAGASALLAIQGAEPSACVWVVAEDRQGARSLATYLVQVHDPKLTLQAPEMVISGQVSQYTATFTDEPELRAQFFWAADMTCADARKTVTDASKLAGPGPGEPGPARWSHQVSRLPFCVAVLAFDEFQVPVVADSSMTTPINGDPVIRPVPATVQSAQPLRLYSDVQLAAGNENDFLPDEPVLFNWKVFAPDGATMTAPPCPGAKPEGVKICFQVTLAGTYRAELTTVDRGVTRSAKPLELVAKDHAPCIQVTQPSSEPPARLAVGDFERLVFTALKIEDDADPLPTPPWPSERGFVWFIRRPGSDAFDWLVNERYPSLLINPRTYRLGDRIEVRLEYRDRLTVADPRARDLGHCKREDAVCESAPGSRCYQWVTWTVDYQ